MLWIYLVPVVVAINCVYYVLFSRMAFHKHNDRGEKQNFPVSLIVCAKNESDNLSKHIPLWLRQDHPKLELILINDASSDETPEVMNSFAQKDPDRVSVVHVKNNEAFWGNKKYALTLGIKRAKSRRMIFTDADCRPASDQWISTMAEQFSTEKQLVLGYGGYEKEKGLLNGLIRFETLMTAVQYFSYALAGIPYMGVGRNMGYTSNLYYANNGFMSHIQLPSGDDDLFVNQAATGKNTTVCLAPEAFTYSVPKKTFSDWIQQKRRHITTSKEYKPLHKFLLGLFYLSSLSFWVLAPLALILGDWKFVLPVVILRFVLQYVIIGRAAARLKEQSLIPAIPLWELFLVFIQMTIFISNTVSKPTRWK